MYVSQVNSVDHIPRVKFIPNNKRFLPQPRSGMAGYIARHIALQTGKLK